MATWEVVFNSRRVPTAAAGAKGKLHRRRIGRQMVNGSVEDVVRHARRVLSRTEPAVRQLVGEIVLRMTADAEEGLR